MGHTHTHTPACTQTEIVLHSLLHSAPGVKETDACEACLVLEEAALYPASSRIGWSEEGHLTPHRSLIHKPMRQQRDTAGREWARTEKLFERGDRGR